MSETEEWQACTAEPVVPVGLNPNASLPYGCTVEHVASAMQEFVDFLTFINQQLHTREIARIETMLMPANFSSMVGEFIGANIPKYCRTLVRNRYHNGHPDLIPQGRYPNDSIQYCHEGIEIKASRYHSGWQGHNPENVWLMVFVFDSNRPVDASQGIRPKSFQFLKVLAAQLELSDWNFSGRSESSRRTITASVTDSGFRKMQANWIYNVARLEQTQPDLFIS